MSNCLRCQREAKPRGKYCATCYRHIRWEQNPELKPKLIGRYSKSRVRVDEQSTTMQAQTKRAPMVLEREEVLHSPWSGFLKMGLRK